MRSRLLRQRGARDAHRRGGQEQLRLWRHQRHLGVAAPVAANAPRAMRAAPAFELPFGIRPADRAVVAALAGASVAAFVLWLWSHIDAAAGPVGHGLAPLLLAGASAAALGAWAGWA